MHDCVSEGLSESVHGVCVWCVCARKHRVRRTEAGSAAATLRILNVVAKPGSDWYAMASGREARMVWTLSGQSAETRIACTRDCVSTVLCDAFKSDQGVNGGWCKRIACLSATRMHSPQPTLSSIVTTLADSVIWVGGYLKTRHIQQDQLIF